jgi:hypothetical protein
MTYAEKITVVDGRAQLDDGLYSLTKDEWEKRGVTGQKDLGVLKAYGFPIGYSSLFVYVLPMSNLNY